MTLRRWTSYRTTVWMSVVWISVAWNTATPVVCLGRPAAAPNPPATPSAKEQPDAASPALLKARANYQLGITAYKEGRLKDARQALQTALDTQQTLVADSLEVAKSFSALGQVANFQGELGAAEDYYRQALAIYQRLAPDSLELAKTWNSLGTARLNGGDLATARTYYRHGLALREKLAPNSLDVASSLNNLGLAALFSGNLEAARDNLHRALAIKQELAPDSLSLASTLGGLASLALADDEPEVAWQYETRALKIHQTLRPGSFQVAYALNVLGRIARHQGKLDKAADYSSRALAMQQELAPGSLALADTLNDLAATALEQGRLDAAQTYYQQAYEIGLRQAPDGLSSAAILNNLGRVARRRGELQQAADYFNRSLETLDVRIGRLAANHQTRGSFRSLYAHYYRDAIDLHLETGRNADAFSVLERSRARSFLAMIAEKELAFTADLPAELTDARSSLAQRYDHIQGQIWRLDPEQDREAIDTLLARLSDLQNERDDIAERVRKASPRLAALQYPEPIGPLETQRALDPGTLLLSYSVGEERSDLFVLSRDSGLEVLPIAVGEAALRRQVDLFREQIAAAIEPETAAAARLFVDQTAERLYDLLIAPVGERIEAADRLLLIADGPLHYLPFAALLRPADQDTVSASHKPYLGMWKPIHNALSATVYTQLKQDRPRSSAPYPFEIAAFGDPVYANLSQVRTPRDPSLAEERVEGDRPRWRNAIDRGLDLSPLPASRREVESIATLYGAEASAVFLGDRATEEHAKTVGPDARFVHFATHGFVDAHRPLDSGLALSMPAALDEKRDNGLLQAWEIFESLRLEADLVVLSACGSSLGKEQGGEGLLSLTRAFQFAGARSVAATLWNVEDQVTAELMVRFYRHLKAGETKDVALHAAQLELIREPLHVMDDQGKTRTIDASAPYYWAAFQLTGDWR